MKGTSLFSELCACFLPCPWNDRIIAINFDDMGNKEANQVGLVVDTSKIFVLHVWDLSSGCIFLVDSGAQVGVIPASCSDKTSSFPLKALQA